MVHITRNAMKFVPLSGLAVIFAASLVCAVSIANNVVAQSGDAATVEKSEGQTGKGDRINGGNASSDTGTNGENYDSKLEPASDDLLGVLEGLIRNKIIPIFPGLFVLLIFSIFFGTINFLSELPEKQKPIRRAYWYLLVWISVNYFLSLTVLLLIIPENVNLSIIDRTLLIYCLVATALPELSSNIRLQMGQSSQSLNLHKYKVMVSDLITQRLNEATNEERSRALESIAHIYSSRLTKFRERLNLLSLEPDLTPEEKSSLTDLLASLKNPDSLSKGASVSSVMRNHEVLIPRFLLFFRDQIEQFQKSVVANLMNRLASNVQLEEANKLVKIGITSLARFMWMSKLRFLRARLASEAGIPEERVQQIYFSTRGKLSLNRRGQVRGTLVVVMLILAVTSIVIFHGGRYLEEVQTYTNLESAIDDEEKY